MNAIEFHKVTKKRKGFPLNNLNFTIPKGFVTGLVGPNGSGKTSTIQLIMNLLKLDEGEIRIFDQSHLDYQVKQKIGFVYDELFMYEDFTIQKMKTFIAPLYESWNDTLYEKYLKKFELNPKQRLKNFSKGMKTKCSLLFALSHEPELIIMDEPTAGLDPIFRRELLDLLQEIMVNEKNTILFSSHITTDLDRIADQIIFIYNGEILLQKNMDTIRENFHLVRGKESLIDEDTRDLFIGLQMNANHFTGLFEGNPEIFTPFGDELVIEPASIEDIMYYLTRKER